MNENYSCDIIRDLLPGYMDHILSEDGTRLVKKHLEKCEKCQQIFTEMNEQMENVQDLGEQIAVDGFRQIRKQTRHLNTAVALLAGALIVFFAAVVVKVYAIGEPIPTHNIDVSDILYDETDQGLTIKGELNFHSHRINKVIWKPSKENSNAVNVIVYAAETLPFMRDDRDFSITIPDMKGKTVYLSCPEYDQTESFDWKTDEYYEELAAG